ncbi:hypothetical protein [Bergeyella zoohelcum]|uniref:Uncharacterized protein conserved in bacteria with the myosin-like domain n=1 Tax=Bergeyella zoohelcum TaxID=1015 RepID=A0A7Z8YS15_9FLAO|nr:hypothetical protein [Bergeyella zoohelcum]VDH05171.1 Uncharacterized protein conserved in bacteria with the myosin-like domain [Bergeyella zoohelcum]
MAIDKLKNLFKQNIGNVENTPSPLSNNVENSSTTYGKAENETYEEWGFKMAKNQNGNTNAFKGCWGLVKEYFRKKEKQNHSQQQAEMNKAQHELEKVEAQIKQKENLNSTIKEKISNLKEKIDNLKKEIFKIEEDPTIIQKDGTNKVGFLVGLVILIGLTIYLFMFYSSATYSAFFKDFTPDDNKVAQAIFDAKAFTKAYHDGIMELILILTIPFAFLGLGYLIHKFQETENKSKYLKIGMLIFITFIFDFILAYGITDQIYGIKRAGSFQEMPEYSIQLAMVNVHFWIIIFAGFIVYLIWGFVFDFTIEAYDKLDFVRKAIQSKESEIKLLEGDIEKENNNIQENQNEINALELKVIEHKKVIDGSVFFVNWERFFHCIGEFTNGWTHWMTANRINQKAIDEVHKINQELINNLKNH